MALIKLYSCAAANAFVYALAVSVPLLLFKETRSWRSFVWCLFLFLGYQYMIVFSDRVFILLASVNMPVGEDRSLYFERIASIIGMFYFIVISSSAPITFKVLKTIKSKIIYAILLILVLFISTAVVEYFVSKA